MTVPLKHNSPRRLAAERFGRLLSDVMERHGVGNKGLGAQLGTSPGLIFQWRNGRNLPRLETALRLSAALGDDRLVSIVREARAFTCEVCGRVGINEGGTPQRYCSDDCKAIRGKMVDGVPTRERAVVAERRLRMHQEAVGSMCGSCEPEGLCRTPGCPLRSVSPLRLAKREQSGVLAIVPDPPKVLSEPHRQALVAATTRRWQRDGERERMAADGAARWAAMTPEERRERGRRIAEGRRRSA